MKKRAFIFDANRCVGCMACVAGCMIENGTELPINWRTVNSQNQIKHPDLPVFHFSLACNHCEEALCMQHCPSLAYTRDDMTGAIIHHAEACIGCTYCTWACPYDAPQFNTKTKIIEKCNFCVDRISEGLKTACADACPVNALDFAWEEEINEEQYLTPGFVNVGIKPSIQLVPLRQEHRQPQIHNLDVVPISKENAISYLPKLKSKVELAKEWPLVFFTLAVSVLVAWFSAGISSGIKVSLAWFSILAAVSIVLSSFHIGKKLRMWRFILNLKNSWLSREIFSFSAFIGIGVMSLYFSSLLLGIVSLVFGIITVISVDMLYQFFIRKEKIKLHSSQLIFTTPLLWAYFSAQWELLFLLIFIKGALYLFRKGKHSLAGFSLKTISTIVRLLLLIVPIIEFFIFPECDFWLVFSLLFLGEIIDRLDFYKASEIRTPESELREELIKDLKNN